MLIQQGTTVQFSTRSKSEGKKKNREHLDRVVYRGRLHIGPTPKNNKTQYYRVVRWLIQFLVRDTSHACDGDADCEMIILLYFNRGGINILCFTFPDDLIRVGCFDIKIEIVKYRSLFSIYDITSPLKIERGVIELRGLSSGYTFFVIQFHIHVDNSWTGTLIILSVRFRFRVWFLKMYQSKQHHLLLIRSLLFFFNNITK